MLEKLNTKTIVLKIVAFLIINFMIYILHPPSVTFLVLSIFVATFTIFFLVISLKQRNPKLYLIYHIGAFTIIFLLGLRFWDISIGISWKMFVCLTPGLILACLLPNINSKLSERLYAAQWFSGSKNLLLLAVLILANTVFVLILWQLFGITEAKNIIFSPFVLFGFLAYTLQLMGIQSGIHTLMNGNLQLWLTDQT